MFLLLPSPAPTSILDMVNSVTQTLQSISVTLKWAQWKEHSTDRQTPFCLFAVCLHRIFKTHQWKAHTCCFGGCTISLRAAESAKKWRVRKSHMFLVPDSSRTAASATTATATLRLYQEKKRERRMKEIPTAVKASKQKCFTEQGDTTDFQPVWFLPQRWRRPQLIAPRQVTAENSAGLQVSECCLCFAAQ